MCPQLISISPGQLLQCMQSVTDCMAAYKLSTEYQFPFISTTMLMMLACGSHSTSTFAALGLKDG